MHQRFVAQEDASDDQTHKVGRQDRFAFGSRGKAAEKKQHQEDELHFRLTNARRAEFDDDEFGPLRHQPKHRGRDDDEDQQPDVKIRE